MTESNIPHGSVRWFEGFDRLVCTQREGRHLTLEAVAGPGRLDMLFFSTFEWGKQAAEIGNILKALTTRGLEVRTEQNQGMVAALRRMKRMDPDRPGAGPSWGMKQFRC